MRDRSSRRAREGDNDSVSNLDAVSAGSRRRGDEYSMSPIKGGDRGVSQDYDRYGENTNRTASQHPNQGTPQMGNQIYVQDMQQQQPYRLTYAMFPKNVKRMVVTCTFFPPNPIPKHETKPYPQARNCSTDAAVLALASVQLKQFQTVQIVCSGQSVVFLPPLKLVI